MKVGFGADHAGLNSTTPFETAKSLAMNVDSAPTLPIAVTTPISPNQSPAIPSPASGLGVVICSNGVGVSIVANKVPGARAALCHTRWGAERARQHTDANVLALGAWEIGRAIADECLIGFLASTPEGGNHERRRDKLGKVERRAIEARANAK